MKDSPGWTIGQSPYFNGKWTPRRTRDFLISERKNKFHIPILYVCIERLA